MQMIHANRMMSLVLPHIYGCRTSGAFCGLRFVVWLPFLPMMLIETEPLKALRLCLSLTVDNY